MYLYIYIYIYVYIYICSCSDLKLTCKWTMDDWSSGEKSPSLDAHKDYILYGRKTSVTCPERFPVLTGGPCHVSWLREVFCDACELLVGIMFKA